MYYNFFLMNVRTILLKQHIKKTDQSENQHHLVNVQIGDAVFRAEVKGAWP